LPLPFADDFPASAGTGTGFIFFLTTTPLRVFLISFFGATEGLGFAAALDADAVMDAAAIFAAADVLAATALHVVRSGFTRQETDKLFEIFDFFTIFLLAKSFLLLLSFSYGVQEHDFIFLKSTKLVG
jgi:hypothetical protein